MAPSVFNEPRCVPWDFNESKLKNCIKFGFLTAIKFLEHEAMYFDKYKMDIWTDRSTDIQIER
jgi:hypothetical protein